jgi:hypothetical protein
MTDEVQLWINFIYAMRGNLALDGVVPADEHRRDEDTTGGLEG